ncbi:MAG: polyprenyl synthetase family protein [Oscillospiraceae bacterium]|nr:polyprenyl synthetase family protein [Oscillospiraceae bacterium]
MDTKKYIDAIEKELATCCDEFFYDNSSVADAARYSLLNAGKRIRAVLLFMTAEMCGKNWKDYLRLASAVEMIHCYSLIHDDLPCMDNDDMRRGKPACHKAFGESTALLAGDALIGLGLETIVNDRNISDIARIKAMKAITRAMGPMGMIYGQELDLEYEDKPADKNILNIIHRHKTGRMISLCGILGSIEAALTNKQEEALKLFFDNIGLVFQIVDDILDVEGDQQQLGKPVGSDSENNKSTFITLYGINQSKEIANELTEQANSALKSEFGDKSESLIEYTTYLLNRKK